MQRLLISALFFIVSLPSLSLAYMDYELSESKRCSSLFSYFEKRLRLPQDTLHSISLQESGKKHSRHDIMVVWPWTINVEGKGYFFKTKREAIRFTKEQLAAGKESIDVGCMQINLKHHPKAFSSLEQAFSPHNNVAYGALFLRQKYDQFGNWEKAVGNYHSADEVLSKKYQKSVRKISDSMYSYKNALASYTFNPRYRTQNRHEDMLAEDALLKAERKNYKRADKQQVKVRVAVGRRKDDDLFRRKNNY
jgi:soluble lytic murein transglycosylase-like protein